jgi:hypothetical protein
MDSLKRTVLFLFIAGSAFAASVEARRDYPGAEGDGRNIELTLKPGADDRGGTLTREAFFYGYGTAGLTDARRNQIDLKNTDRIVMPVMSFKFASTQNDAGTFYPVASDQAETLPPAVPKSCEEPPGIPKSCEEPPAIPKVHLMNPLETGAATFSYIFSDQAKPMPPAPWVGQT